MIHQLFCHTPIGEITLTQLDDHIISLDWGVGRDQSESPLLKEAVEQIQAYFDGDLTVFDLPLAPPVSPFTQKVLQEMQHIPYGETRTYADIARAIKTAPRAIGGACGRNPIPIIIPCHRILSTTGLGGYSGEGGLSTKTALLSLERALQPGD